MYSLCSVPSARYSVTVADSTGASGSSSKTTLARSARTAGSATQSSSYCASPAAAKRNAAATVCCRLTLASRPVFDIRPVGTLAHQRMATHDDAVYRFRLRCETGAQFETGVDYREQHDPARIGVVCVIQHFPVLADPVCNTCEIGRIARHCIGLLGPLNPPSANSAAASPFFAALPTARLFAMLPILSTRLADCVEAWPRAQARSE